MPKPKRVIDHKGSRFELLKPVPFPVNEVLRKEPKGTEILVGGHAFRKGPNGRVYICTGNLQKKKSR